MSPLPPGATGGLCRGCGDPMMWVRTVNGKNLPVNVDQTDDGNVAVYRGGDGRFYGRTLSKAAPELRNFERRYTPHMATCSALQRRREKAASKRSTASIPLSGNREVVVPPRR